ncbi:tRNA threonylcarbamoyladenosine biosynthesis protein TsaE [Mariprofundus micogutta]|uniref:tRNA threonylcarbamoyladenosine biosynthesis protein TsaE n=1 Tax=Mariprofundus micogutta TaxID=1921010 RepID=A0A1L8CPZ0_9PROT|nr:tRNA (adenosine(37)-N6)-threonylcarbamoyltransferase complex ATPase subunit type 1 TsaE [Mariprofundus micogutta]GAV20978.1 tRNA threonylcarbamoyladenosine biosynthesis protein TsaE [Mariprofundus micogutta]
MRISHNESETVSIAAELASSLKPGDVVALYGELGAGKSVFCRAILRALGVTDEALPSPTFAIIQEYQGEHCQVAHMDWYRLDAADEIEMLGVRDFFQPPWIALIEWPERAPDMLQSHVIRVYILPDANDPELRSIEIERS